MKNSIIIVIFLLLSITVNAQKNELLAAFESSYINEQNRQPSKALENLKEVYESFETNYELNLRLGWLSYITENNNDSEKYYAKAMQLKPLALDAIYGYILPLLVEKKYNDVIRFAEKALTISQNDSRAEYYIGLANYYKKKYIEAEKHLEKAINRYPFDLDINLILGWTKFALGKKNEAKVLFQVAQRHSPNSEVVKSAIELINK
jgi:tetratricopeptide (TPR) repeat protein